MADWIIEQTVEMTRPTQPYTSRPVELMLPGDHLAHTWRIKCLERGLPADLTGFTASGYFKRMDGNYVLITGSISSNTVSVTLTQECYAYPGNLRGVVRIANANTDAVVTLADRLFFVQSAVDDGGTVDPGEVIPSLADLLAEIDAMETATAAAEAAAAAVPDMIAPTFSTSEAYASGDYVYYDGDLYRFTAAHAAGAWTGTDAVEVQLSPEVAGLKSALKYATDVERLYVTQPGYFKLSGSTVNPADIGTGSWKHESFDCAAGDIFSITGSSYGAAARLYAFVDSSYNVLEVSGNGVGANALQIIAPTNSAKLLVNEDARSNGTPVTLYKGARLSERIDTLDADVLAIDGATKETRSLLLVELSDNLFPQIESSEYITGYHLADGETVTDSNMAYINKYIPVDGNMEYTIGFIPAFGSATLPWHDGSAAGEFYDANKHFLKNINKSSGTFTTPLAARYIRINVKNTSGIGRGTVNDKCMLVHGGTRPDTYTAYDGQDVYLDATTILDEIGEAAGSVQDVSDTLDTRTLYKSPNLYDGSLQTSDTISPHYYVNGAPYSSTQFDGAWNCTAMFEIEPSTKYTIGLVPAANGSIVKPWNNASQGFFFYDATSTYISQSANSTFTTPANAKYARFNYNIADGNVTLSILNATCMLVKGDTLPDDYEPFYDYDIKGKIAIIEDDLADVAAPINYIIEDSGNTVTLISKYNGASDLAVTLKKKGGNNLFDFYKLATVANATKQISKNTADETALMTTPGDWFAPFVVLAKGDIDGDAPSSQDFTGGNHQYNNQGSGSTATARTSALQLKADNIPVSSGSGSCKRFEMLWTNLVQGSNTKKSDGTGREILQENHRLIFDGTHFEFFVDLLPLEDVTVKTWYGIQWFTSIYPNLRYIGGANRAEYAANTTSECGDAKCCHVVGFGTSHEVRIDVDQNYDLGDHKYLGGTRTDAIFCKNYGKGYFFIINNTDLDDDDMYSLHGWMQFNSIT